MPRGIGIRMGRQLQCAVRDSVLCPQQTGMLGAIGVDAINSRKISTVSLSGRRGESASQFGVARWQIYFEICDVPLFGIDDVN